ncbi:MAG: hypothetical protein KIC92_10040, partial [Clostridiales bacterium]|nr:hypothetical protein [Clostridiales bacterium]
IDDDVGKNISEELQNPNININKASNSGSGVEISNSKINNKKPYKIKVINGDDLNKMEFLKIDINKDKLIEKITDKENKQAHIFSNEHISGKNNNNIGFNTLQIDLNMSEEDMKKYVINHISKILEDINNTIGFPIGRSTQIRTKINNYDLEIRFYAIPPDGKIGSIDAFLGYGGELKSAILIEKY